MRRTGDPELDEQLTQFGENLRSARRRAGLTQIELGARAKLDRAAVSFLERAERAPDLPTIVRIARAVEVKPAVLLRGLGDAPKAHGPTHRNGVAQPGAENPAARFGSNLRWSRKRVGISQEALAGEADVDRAAISVFERGRRDPNLRTVLKLARALAIPPGILLKGIE